MVKSQNKLDINLSFLDDDDTELVYCCDYCGKEYKSENACINHEKICTSNKRNISTGKTTTHTYSCDYCGEEFSTKKACVEHELSCQSNPNLIEQAENVKGKMFCGNCGTELSPDSKFCNRCGEKVVNENEKVITPKIAHQNSRFINLIIDSIVIYFISYITMSTLGTNNPENDAWGITYILISIVYYLTTELIWQKTLAKFITRTTVINEFGEKPTTGQVIKRTLFRYMPLEAFSFFTYFPVGWHDKWAGTRVVSDR